MEGPRKLCSVLPPDSVSRLTATNAHEATTAIIIDDINQDVFEDLVHDAETLLQLQQEGASVFQCGRMGSPDRSPVDRDGRGSTAWAASLLRGDSTRWLTPKLCHSHSLAALPLVVRRYIDTVCAVTCDKRLRTISEHSLSVNRLAIPLPGI